MSKFNPALANIALCMLDKLEKRSFIPMDQASMQAQQQQEAAMAQQQQAQQAPQGQPPAQGQPPQGGSPTTDDLRTVVREEVEAAQDKPKKQSVDERITALEGAFLRVLQYLGLIPKQETDLDAGLPQDADKMQQQGAEQGSPDMAAQQLMGGGGEGAPLTAGAAGQPSTMDMGGGDPMAAAMPKMGSVNNPFSGIAQAVARLKGKTQ
jgi:hypothetical protein